MEELAVKIEHVSKQYRLGAIGGGTLRGDLQTWWARVRGKEDPNSKIGAQTDVRIGERFLALDDINLEVKKGEALGIIGHNGAGKSTLLKLLCRVTAPTAGRISLNGRIASMLEVGTGFHPEMTGRENIFMNGAILGMTKKEIDAKMEQIIDFSEVRQFIDTPVKRYSSGMYVKLAFSVAAHLNSEIMIMDEVLAVGDMAFQKKCLTKMREAAKKEGRTVLYVSHNMNTIRQLCDRCVVLDHGHIEYIGDVEEAISVYSGTNKTILPAFYDLRQVIRPSNQHGHRLKMLEFSFIDKECASYDTNEAMRIRIMVQANETISNIKFYFIISLAGGQTVGMTESANSIPVVEEGKTYNVEAEFNISNLAEGKYVMQTDVFSDDGEGNHWSYDHPSSTIAFEKTDFASSGLKWQHQFFGAVKLNPIFIRNGQSL